MSRTRRRAVASNRRGIPDRNDEGAAICRWCRAVVKPPRRTFCGDACVHEWRLRSDPRYVRKLVWERDGGRCLRCRADVGSALRQWKRERPPSADRRGRRAWRAARPRWDADHILPVSDGGGECGLENYRLLCRTCHVEVTAKWRQAHRDAASLLAERSAVARLKPGGVTELTESSSRASSSPPPT